MGGGGGKGGDEKYNDSKYIAKFGFLTTFGVASHTVFVTWLSRNISGISAKMKKNETFQEARNI